VAFFAVLLFAAERVLFFCALAPDDFAAFFRALLTSACAVPASAAAAADLTTGDFAISPIRSVALSTTVPTIPFVAMSIASRTSCAAKTRCANAEFLNGSQRKL
jgi:hypothetical protein